MPDDIPDEEYDKEFARVYSGIFRIGYSGCTGFLGIMLSGENQGRIVHINEELEYRPQFDPQANFLDWYENWLDNIIEGRFSHGRPYMTEEECFTRYAGDKESCWKLVSLEYIRNQPFLSADSLKILWRNYTSEKDETVKRFILNLLAKFDYEKAKIELEKLSYINPLEFLKILYLYAPGKIPEWAERIEGLPLHSSNPEVAEYIKYVILPLGLKMRPEE